MMQESIERDLKAALLSGDKTKVETLKTIKNALLYEAVNKSLDRGQMDDDQVSLVLTREAKKRQEAADMYAAAGETARAELELAEKKIIDDYLPEPMSESELSAIVDDEVAKAGEVSVKDMGRIIGAVKARASNADGASIARLVKQRLQPW